MAYSLFLFDADDTLFDFTASEERAFAGMLEELGAAGADCFRTYREVNAALWRALELGQVTKQHLKSERFRRTFEAHGLELDPVQAGEAYLDRLAGTVLLKPHAEELCRKLADSGELAIITNGIGSVQRRRLEASPLAPYVSYMIVSEEHGFEKPDARLFEIAASRARRFEKRETLMVGDRLETDIEGAHRFGIDACWLNPLGREAGDSHRPRFEIRCLSELTATLADQN